MIPRFYSRIPNLLWLALWLGLVCSACNSAPTAAWDQLETAPDSPVWSALPPVWDNQNNEQALDIRLVVEPYCRNQECKDFIRQTVPWATALANARVRVYDLPKSQEGKSFLFSAIGRCISLEDPARYLIFLEKAQNISDAYDNNVEMQTLSKAILGKYDSSCINKQAKALQQAFENTALGLKQVPVVWINGRIYYGVLTPQEGKNLLTTLPITE